MQQAQASQGGGSEVPQTGGALTGGVSGYTTLFSPVVSMPGAPGYAPYGGYAMPQGVPLGAPPAPASGSTGWEESGESKDVSAGVDGEKKKSKKTKIKGADSTPAPTMVAQDMPFSGALKYPGALGFLPPPPASLPSKSSKKAKKAAKEQKGLAPTSGYKGGMAQMSHGLSMMPPPMVMAQQQSQQQHHHLQQQQQHHHHHHHMSKVGGSTSLPGPALILPAALPITPASALTEGKGKGDFVCQVCSKEFVTKGSLKTHSRVHTGERPYACPMCPKSFTQQANCSRHIRLMHRENAEALPIKIADPPKLAVPIIKVPKTKKAKQKMAEAIAARNASASVIAAVKEAPPGAVFFPPTASGLFPPANGGHMGHNGGGVPPPPPPPPGGGSNGAGAGQDAGNGKKKKGKKKGEAGEKPSSSKRAKGDKEGKAERKHSSQDMMYEAQQHMQQQQQGGGGGHAQFNVLSSHYPPYDWGQSMRSPLMGASSGGSSMQGGSNAAAAAAAQGMPPNMALGDWNQFRSKSPPAVYQGQNQNPQDWMMRSKSPMPNSQNGAAAAAAAAAAAQYSYPMISSDVASMYAAQEQMYPPMMYAAADPSGSYGMMHHHAQQLSPNSQRKMAMAAAEYQNAMNMGGFPGYFQQPQYMAYGAGPGDMSGAHQQQGGQGHNPADPYGGAFEFAGHFDPMGDHAAMMMGAGGGAQQGQGGHDHE